MNKPTAADSALPPLVFELLKRNKQLPQDDVTFPLSEIQQIALECRPLIRKYAVGSGIGSAVPILGADIATDAILATSMLNEILSKFALSRTEIDLLELEARAMILEAIKTQGCQLVGQVITRQLVLRLAARSAAGTVIRRVGKYVPLIGQVTAAGIGYATMTSLGNMIVAECVRVRRRVVQTREGQQ